MGKKVSESVSEKFGTKKVSEPVSFRFVGLVTHCSALYGLEGQGTLGATVKQKKKEKDYGMGYKYYW